MNHQLLHTLDTLWQRAARRTIALAGLIALACGGGNSKIGGPDDPGGPPGFKKLSYQQFVPASYAQSTAKYPLIIALHGAGGLIAEDNLIEVQAKRATNFPFVVVAPVTGSSGWTNAALDTLYFEVLQKFRIDASRVYLTGLSMGARGAWDNAVENPRRFAAIALISGGGLGDGACAIKDVPLWIFHNREDPVVPLADAQQLNNAARACGAIPRFTVYDFLPAGQWAHNAWKEAWTTQELYDWFLNQHTTP